MVPSYHLLLKLPSYHFKKIFYSALMTAICFSHSSSNCLTLPLLHDLSQSLHASLLHRDGVARMTTMIETDQVVIFRASKLWTLFRNACKNILNRNLINENSFLTIHIFRMTALWLIQGKVLEIKIKGHQLFLNMISCL